MSNLSLLAVLGVAGLATAPAALPSGWEVHQADRFCYIWLSAPEPGGTEFALALDPSSKATIILTNAAWQLHANRDYQMTASISGVSKRMKARGMKLTGDKMSLVANVQDPSFVDRFAASSKLDFQVTTARGAGRGSFDLVGAPAATEALRSCQRRLEIRSVDVAKDRVERETTFRTDPVAAQDARESGMIDD